MADQRALVEQILAGDNKAFKTLITDNQRLVSHVVFRMIRPGPDQEDICQEVFIKVYQNLDRFRFDSKLSTWIARIAYTSCLNFLDKKKLPLYDDLGDEGQSFEPVGKEADRPDFRFEESEVSDILKAEIDDIPPVYRTIVTLYHLDQMSYAEIAKIMKMPEGTVKSYLFRARKLLKEKLLAKYKREEL
ncbi:MAG: sigma-70 family RNA polymerase sigma factor [candidate division Zixibacteria bacterium]|nr:sigma-70 family RNA polymerase sigma factor [candidate division Zixibacteria bacterium]